MPHALSEALRKTLPDQIYTTARALKWRIRNSLPYRIARNQLGSSRSHIAIDEVSGFQVAYRAGTTDEIVIRESFAHDPFFPALPDYTPHPTDVIVDVGAHIGTFTLLAATKAPKGIVHAVEASQESYNLLRINICLNHLSNVQPHHLALTDSSGFVRLHHDREGNWGHSTTTALSHHGEEVRSEELSSFFELNAIRHVNFMKLNCEGAEFPIIMSCPDMLLRRVERMLVLYHCELARGYSLENLLEKLKGAGFFLEVVTETSTRGCIKAVRVEN